MKKVKDVKPKVEAKTEGDKSVKPVVKVGKPRNYELTTGIMRYGRIQMYKKKAMWRYSRKRRQGIKRLSVKLPKKPATETRMIKKQIGGEKNGEFRTVRVKKLPNYYPTQEIPRRRLRVTKPGKGANLRKSFTPGTVCILLAGKHKGKRVVFLKQLKSGLLLVTGPFWFNRCPLRRMNQAYVIGTSTKIDLGANFQVPDHINDDYFKRMKLKAPKKDEGDVFQTKKLKYTISVQRKTDQNRVDRQVVRAMHVSDPKGCLYKIKYLCSKFGLSRYQYPHRMKF